MTSCAGTVPNGSLIDTSSVGAKTFTVTATDAAGLTVTQTVTYNVAYALCPRSRAASGLGTVIFQISLCDANGMDVSARTVGVHIVGVSPAPAQPIASAQLTFKYLPFAGYIDFVTTKGWASGPYTMMFSAGGDPTVHSLPFTAKNLPIP